MKKKEIDNFHAEDNKCELSRAGQRALGRAILQLGMAVARLPDL